MVNKSYDEKIKSEILLEYGLVLAHYGIDLFDDRANKGYNYLIDLLSKLELKKDL